MDLLLLTIIPISKWGDFWLGASRNHKAERTKNSLNYSVKRSSLRNRTLQRTRGKEGSVAGNQLALIIMMDRMKLRCHFSRFISSSLLSKFINMELKSLSCRIWGTYFFLHNLYEYQCLGKWKINSSCLVPRGAQAGFLCAALQLLLTCSTSTQFWARIQLPVHPSLASPGLFIHTPLLLMQKAAYVITCSPSVDCPHSSTDALESCLTLSHAIPVLLLHPSHHVPAFVNSLHNTQSLSHTCSIASSSSPRLFLKLQTSRIHLNSAQQLLPYKCSSGLAQRLCWANLGLPSGEILT